MSATPIDAGRDGHATLVDSAALTLRSEREGDIHYLSIWGELDLAGIEDFDAELLRIEDTDALAIIVDLSGLEFIDSSGIGCLVVATDRADGRLAFLRPPDGPARVLRVAGVERHLPFVDWPCPI